MEPVKLENSVDIILTPQFYTFLREELEIKFAYQAKQIAASLFDDYIDTTENYQYYVYKCDDAWCFYAYNIEEIDYFLESKGIEKHRVAKIYFAQELEPELTKPLLLSGNHALQSIDGVVTMVPKRFLGEDVEYTTLDMNNLKLKHGVTMGSSLNSFVSLKETIILGSLFALLGTAFVVEGNRIKSSIANEDAKLSALIDENPKYGSAMLRESILNKYQPIDTTERAKRQAVKDISKLLSAKSQLKELTIDKNVVSAVVSTQNKEISKQVKEHAKVKKMKTTDMGTGLDLKVEVKL
jgi:ribosomal protein L31E